MVYSISLCHFSNQSFLTQDTFACQIWVWLLNSHQEKTKLRDMQELQVSEQIASLRWSRKVIGHCEKNLYYHVGHVFLSKLLCMNLCRLWIKVSWLQSCSRRRSTTTQWTILLWESQCMRWSQPKAPLEYEERRYKTCVEQIHQVSFMGENILKSHCFCPVPVLGG